jgi:dienelactone hydrolase
MRRWLSVALMIGSALARFPDFAAPGPYGDTYRVADIPGTTELMTGCRIFYPDSTGVFPQSAVRAPIVAFGHAWLVGISSYYSYARHLASWGCVVVLPTYSNPIIAPEHDKRARLMADAARWVAARDTIPDDHFFGKLDRWNWGFAGHSMGGSISMLAAETLGLGDTLRAVASLAGPQSSPPTHSERLYPPKLVMAGGTDNIAPWPDIRQAFWSNAPAPGTFAVIHNAGHLDFMDGAGQLLLGRSSPFGRETTQLVARRHLTAFFQRYLRNDRGDWNYAYVFGDSILHHPTMDSVEVRPDLTGTEERAVEAPDEATLSPDPTNTRFVIRYFVARPGPVEIAVYDRSGRRLATIASGSEPAGTHTETWTALSRAGTRLPAGEYVVRIRTAAGSTARRLSLVN